MARTARTRDETEGTALPTRLASQIIERVRMLKLPAGSHLPEQGLADAFRVSRTPLRLALRLLEKMDVVENRRNCGFFLKKAGDHLEGAPVVLDDLHEEPLYFRIAEDRLNGRLEARFTEAELCRRYGVTKARLARLLARMTKEGWLDRLPGHGWEFQPVFNSPTAYDQSYRFRMLIEPTALLEPTYKVDREAFARVREQQQAMLNGGILRFSRAETFQIGATFHETIVAASNNSFLLDGLRRVNQVRRLLEYRIHKDRMRLLQECTDHVALLDMLEAGENENAAEFLRKHLNRARGIKIDIALRYDEADAKTPKAEGEAREAAELISEGKV